MNNLKMSTKVSVGDNSIILVINKAGVVCNYYLADRELRDIKKIFLRYICKYFGISMQEAIDILNYFLKEGY